MTHGAKFDWGKVYYAGIRLGYDNGYAAYRADMAEKRWENKVNRREGRSKLTVDNLAGFAAGTWPKNPAIHLYRIGDRVKVAVKVDGKWVDVIDEFHDAPFSHIVESGGIERCIAEQCSKSDS